MSKNTERTTLLPQVPSQVSAISTVVIAISDSREAEYAFDWALHHILQYGNRANRKIVLLNVISTVTKPAYYLEAATSGEYLAVGKFFLGCFLVYKR
jgi:hypothetical protein